MWPKVSHTAGAFAAVKADGSARSSGKCHVRLLVHHCAICHNARGTARGTNLKRSEQNMVNILKRIWIFVHFEEVPRVVRVTCRVMPSSGCCMGRSSMWGRYSCRFKAIEHLGLWLMWSCGCLCVCVCVFLGIIEIVSTSRSSQESFLAIACWTPDPDCCGLSLLWVALRRRCCTSSWTLRCFKLMSWLCLIEYWIVLAASAVWYWPSNDFDACCYQMCFSTDAGNKDCTRFSPLSSWMEPSMQWDVWSG